MVRGPQPVINHEAAGEDLDEPRQLRCLCHMSRRRACVAKQHAQHRWCNSLVNRGRRFAYATAIHTCIHPYMRTHLVPANVISDLITTLGGRESVTYNTHGNADAAPGATPSYQWSQHQHTAGANPAAWQHHLGCH